MEVPHASNKQHSNIIRRNHGSETFRLDGAGEDCSDTFPTDIEDTSVYWGCTGTKNGHKMDIQGHHANDCAMSSMAQQLCCTP